ncbi:hypothetical protein SteCoe_2565 [Stentor coeruleus]|uniref:Uncharacterized protein n=1 Tax=Stentor coeruleus TaxID=5963 RepID=A0A1R2CIP4_9CILI|nr:hypothetical protein SteCoe_9106 [Stentor coeruleus]OMJ94360.1 hypothetical protein SteCoe_2565 [Stentor coeruleus]
MDIKQLQKLHHNPTNEHLQPEMRPKGNFEEILKCDDYQEFFALNFCEVGNLYKAEKTIIRFKHESDLIITKCEGPLKETIEFKVEFSSRNRFESGINYLGVIKITNPEEKQSFIRIFGEGSYDPGSPEKYLSKHDYTIINGFIVTALYSARRGAPKTFIDRIFQIIKCHPVCVKHNLMIEYMEYQINTACYNFEEPEGYEYFLKNWAEKNYQLMRNKEYEDLLTYIYLTHSFEEKHIFPCKSYIDALVTNRNARNEIIAFANEEPNVYIKPDLKFVQKFCKIKDKCIDMRILEEQAEFNDQKYREAIADVLRKRDEESSDPSIRNLTDLYYQCRIF